MINYKKMERIIYFSRVKVDKGEEYPWKDVEACMDKTLPALSDHLPCPICGKPSEELKWIRFMTPKWTWKNFMGVGGPMSICTDCHRQVEFTIQIRN